MTPLLLALLLASAPESVKVPLRDGTFLAADVYRPLSSRRRPAIVVQTPYDRTRFRPDRQARRLHDPERYGWVVADWRGFFGSRAAGGATRGNRGEDGFDLVEWVAAQDWCDGKVGTWGGSALGEQQFATAMARPPHLVCCVPLVSPMGISWDRYYEGGVLLENHLKTLRKLGFRGLDLVERFPDPGALAWKIAERNTHRPELLQVPMLLVTGWWDNFPDAVLRTFDDLRRKGGEATREHSRLLIGPWAHTTVDSVAQGGWEFPGAEGAAGDAARAFFDHWLLGLRDGGWERTPPVRYWRVGEERFVGAGEFPGVPTEALRWSLGADGSIGPGEGNVGARGFRADPADLPPTLGGANLPPLPFGPTDHGALERRKDLLVYASAPMEKALPLAGRPLVELKAASDAETFDLAVWLCVGEPDGRSLLLAETILRCSGATGGKVFPIRLPPVAATLGPGRTLRLYVAGGNRPRYAAPRGAAAVTIAHPGSSLLLPVAGS